MTVYLVGAGPGDPELLTMKAARLLAQADAVVYDRLAEPSLTLVPATTARFNVGKHPGGSNHQAEINQLLVDLGRSGLSVVRLKGGDPLVFGRGGEEAMALSAAGVPWELVPGVTSAVAAPESAGIPVTHRGVSDSVTIVTGHRKDGCDTNWEALAQAGGTLVILMGVADRAEIARRLQFGGMPADTPVAAIMNGTLATEQVVRTTLASLAETPMRSPATIVVGAVAALRLDASDFDYGTHAARR